jgi:shikimate kinase
MDSHSGKKKLIYLAGFMGSGKSTIGPILANTIGYRFVDVDREIEEQSGKSVSAMFQEEGESAFRAVERSVLGRVSGLEEAVVSLGGGTVAQEENFRIIRSTGVIVYLQLSPEEALRRMKHKTDRPMLRDESGRPLGEDALEKRIRQLLDSRELFYKQADIIVPTEKQSVGNTVDIIVRKLRKYVQV